MNRLINIFNVLGVILICYIMAEKRFYFDYLNEQEGCYVSEKLFYDINVRDVRSTEFLEVVPSPHSYFLTVRNSNLQKLHVPGGLRVLYLTNVNCMQVDPGDLQSLEMLVIKNGNVNIDFIGKLKNLKSLSLYGRNYVDVPDLSELENIENITLDARIHMDEYNILTHTHPKASVFFHLFYADD